MKRFIKMILVGVFVMMIQSSVIGAQAPNSTQITLPSGNFSTILLMDVSGSMGDQWQGGVKIESAKDTATKLIYFIGSDTSAGVTLSDAMSIILFSSGAQVYADWSTDYNGLQSSLSNIGAGGGTNMGEGLTLANTAFAASPQNNNKVVFLLSDGVVSEGMDRDAILNGPVQDAVSAGICINTIGFGDPGDIDEELLKEIAHRTGCQYFYADPNQLLTLENAFIAARHSSVGQILTQIQGEVQQDQTTPPQSFQVPSGRKMLVGTANWTNAILDLILTDPSGNIVDDTYPGAIIDIYDGLAHITVKDPMPGTWTTSMYGKDVQVESAPYNIIVSVPNPVLSAPDIPGWLILVLAGIILGALLVFAIMNNRRGHDQAGLRLVSGKATPSQAFLVKGQLHLGRAPNNDIVIPYPQVSSRHAKIKKIPQGYLVEDLDSQNGTYINGLQVKRQIINAGDNLQIGSSKFIFEAVLGAKNAKTIVASSHMMPPVSSSGVRVISGNATPIWTGLGQGQINIGRDTQNQITVNDDRASRQHLRIYSTPQGYMLEDLNSQNGTYINGQQASSQVLKNGDVIQIGQVQLRIEL